MAYRRTPLGVVLAFAVLVLCGCDMSHVNEPDAFAIHFKNDLGRPMRLALCPGDASTNCAGAYYEDQVAPGAVDVENISPDVRTEWAVESISGGLVKCVVLYWKYWPGHDEAVRLSQAPAWATPCSRTTPATPQGTN